MNKLIVVVLTMLMVGISAGIRVQADEVVDIVLNGESEIEIEDFADVFVGMMPGDSRRQVLRICGILDEQKANLDECLSFFAEIL